MSGFETDSPAEHEDRRLAEERRKNYKAREEDRITETLHLRAENAALREELQRQWEAAHMHECDCESGRCIWPKPKILEQPK